MIEIVCYVCGKQFKRKSSLIKRAKNPTCSLSCRNNMYKTSNSIKVNCVICKKEMIKKECVLKHRKNNVCSYECKRQLLSNLKTKNKIEIKCPICQKDFIVFPYRIKQGKNLTCSKSCGSKLRFVEKVNHPRYKNQITNLERMERRSLKENVVWRNKVLANGNYTCDICKKYGGKLNAHHLEGYHWNKEQRLNLENGIVLCEKHHKKFHSTYGQKNNTKKQYLKYANANRRLYKV